MRLFLVCGSHNRHSQSIKVTNFVAQRAEEKDFDSTFVLDLGINPMPLWTPDFKKHFAGDISYSSIFQEIDTSQALVIVTPEWSGMATPAIKNFFLHFSNPVLFHKPALIVAVSAGRGGAYPVAELRASSYKNTKLCYIPEHVIVRNVQEVLNDSIPCSKNDIFIRDRIDFSLLVLKEYAKGLSKIRSANLDFEKFQYGM